MKWKVTYREKNGVQTVRFFDEENRDRLFQVLSAKGINAIRVEEANDGVKTNSIPKPTILIVAVVLSLSIVGFLIINSVKNRDGETINVASKQYRPLKRPEQNLRPVSKQIDQSVNPVVTNTPKREIWLGREIVSSKVVTNGTNLIITRIDTDGKVHKEYTTIHKRLFSNPVDITLSILLTTPEGALIPPLPPLGPRSGDIFAEALKKPIEISDDDTPEEKHIKQLVMAAREEMLEELKNGKTVNEVIEDHCSFVDANNKLRAEAMVQYKGMVADGDMELAEQFREKANEMLTQKGAAPLKSLAEIHEERISNREKKR